ncbi:MAG: DUF2339 domain-containing protein [Sumerlaeia bacterium]
MPSPQLLPPEKLQEALFSNGRRVAALELKLQKIEAVFPYYLGEDEPELSAAAPPVAAKMAAVPPPLPRGGAPAIPTGPFPVPTSPPKPAPAEERSQVVDAPPPIPVPEPVAAPAWQPPQPATPPPLPPRVASYFGKEKEAEGPAAAGPPALPPAADPEKTEAGWELNFAKLLPWIGGPLVLIGAAIMATLAVPRISPMTRTLASFALSALIIGGGYFVRKRHDLIGRATAAVGLALAYFTAFAGGYLPAMQAFPRPVSLVLMGVLAAGFVGLAKRWQSQATAIFGFALAVLAVLLSASTAGPLALLPLLVLAAAAGWLLITEEWRALTAFTLIGAYGSTAALWFLSPVAGAGETLAHLGAIVAYHVVFTAAFWKWGRVWMARERAMEAAPDHDAVPALPAGLLPYSLSFSMLNSIGLIATSLFLLWHTDVYWAQVQWVLYGLAALEGARLLVPSLSRGDLSAFHAVTAFGLATAALVTQFTGIGEAAALAALTLAVAVAASWAKDIALLRPLSIGSAGLAIFSYGGGGPLTNLEVLIALAPLAMIAASALPWELLRPRPRPWTEHASVRALESLSGRLRVLAAALVALVVLFQTNWTNAQNVAAVFLVGLVLLGGRLFLRARAWSLAAAVLLGLAMLSSNIQAWEGLTSGEAMVLWTLALIMLGLLNSLARRARSPFESTIFCLFAAGIGVGFLPWTYRTVESTEPMLGLALAFCGGAFIAAELLFNRLPALPAFVGDLAEEGTVRRDLAPLAWARVGVLAGVLLVGYGVLVAVSLDARDSLVSASVIAAALLGVWLRSTLRPAESRPRILEAITAGGALITISAAILVHGRLEVGSTAVLLPVGAGLLALGLWRRSQAAIYWGMGLCGAVPLLFILSAFEDRSTTLGEAQLGLVVGGGLLLAAQALRFVWSRRPAGNAPSLEEEAGGHWITGTGVGLIVLFLSTEVLIPRNLVTVTWGGIAVASLAAGFAVKDKTLRGAGLVLLGMAILRIFLVELEGSDTMTKAIAFLGVGLLTIVAGLGYGFLRNRVKAEERRVRERNGE